jgi:hypothetical protein
MSSIKSYVGRKAAKATVAHTVNGTVSKARRQPLRSVTLLGLGGLIGALVTLVAEARRHRGPTMSQTA